MNSVVEHDAAVRIAILGATGSIGESTLDVLRRHVDHFEVTLLTAHSNIGKLASLAAEWRPRHVAVSDVALFSGLKKHLPASGVLPSKIHAGMTAISDLCASAEVDVVVAGMVGAAGVGPVLAAAKAGKTILLANKESLVMAGDIVMRAARRHGACIIPLDSEHNAIFQCLPDSYRCGQTPPSVNKLILTASGGPFWQTPASEFFHITPEQACNHPKWRMGRKISVDSATLMNKGLELIEAHWLFGLPASQLDVYVHPQSLVHSLVAFEDGSLLAQLGEPDMRIPIAYGLARCMPQGNMENSRIRSGANLLDLLASGPLEFYPPDMQRFPALDLARTAINTGGTAPAALNASNEEAVNAFLQSRIGFMDIFHVNLTVMESIRHQPVESFEHLQRVDVEARTLARHEIHKIAR